MSDRARHNHVTRDIKPRGACPACNAFHERVLREATAPTSDDVATCTVCMRTVFRTNIDGRWHHPGAVTDHDPIPTEEPRGL